MIVVLFLNDILYKCIFFHFFNNCRQLRNDLNIIIYDMLQAFNMIRMFVTIVFLSLSLCKFFHKLSFFSNSRTPPPHFFSPHHQHPCYQPVTASQLFRNGNVISRIPPWLSLEASLTPHLR